MNAPICFKGFAPSNPQLQICVPESGETEIRNRQSRGAIVHQPFADEETPRLVCTFGSQGIFERLTTHGGFAPLGSDYPLPKHVMMGLPVLASDNQVIAFNGSLLRGREIEPDPSIGDIIMDWSGNVFPDAVLVSRISNEVTLCFHYQLSTQLWLGLSLRNVPITIMGERRVVGVVQRATEGRPNDWRGFLSRHFVR